MLSPREPASCGGDFPSHAGEGSDILVVPPDVRARVAHCVRLDTARHEPTYPQSRRIIRRGRPAGIMEIHSLMRRFSPILTVCLLWFSSRGMLQAQEDASSTQPSTDEQLRFFEASIRPLLIDHCND